MQCHICSRQHGPQLSFNCSTCARSALYGLRVELGQALLDNNTFVRQINPIIASATKEPSSSRAATGQKWSRLSIEEASAKAERSAERTLEISGHLQILRKEIEEGKAEIAKRKAALAQRRSDASSANHNLKARRAATLETVEKGTKKLNHRWNSLHTKTVEARVFLCREAADLYRLRQRKRKKGGSFKEDYTIGGVGIVDLRDLNSMRPSVTQLVKSNPLITRIDASPAQITASLTNLAYLLLLASHYLLLRLPAEITLPRKDYPLPTIFSPSSSYLSKKEVPFPGTSLPNSSNNSPSTSRTADLRQQPRPRPLYLEKPLQILAKDNPSTYALFIEGVTLLAWNIAWVCRTQGHNIGSNSWEEVCAMGKNLHSLLTITPSSHEATPLHQQPSSRENPSTKNTPITTKDQLSSSPINRNNNNNNNKQPQIVRLGHYSHGTAHSFLNSAQGTEYMRTWPLSSPYKIIDALKANLSNEMGVAEWEYLDPQEWNETTTTTNNTNNPRNVEVEIEVEKDEEGVLVGSTISNIPPQRRGITTSNEEEQRKRTVSRIGMPVGSERETQTGDERKEKGTSGWTKLKSR
ncbi:MAG: hypothetical protein M1812_006412 [Candelaria pacifica]|nr:MAG: hypothetical protein M1812_006412 [Candelaria pacifica]